MSSFHFFHARPVNRIGEKNAEWRKGSFRVYGIKRGGKKEKSNESVKEGTRFLRGEII